MQRCVLNNNNYSLILFPISHSDIFKKWTVLSTENRKFQSLFFQLLSPDIDTWKKKKKRHKVISVIFHFLYTLYLPPLLFLHKRQIWVVQVIAWVMAILGNEIFAETLCPWKLIHKNTGGIVEAVKEDSNGFSILLCQLSSCFFHFVVLFIWRSECIFFFFS